MNRRRRFFPLLLLMFVNLMLAQAQGGFEQGKEAYKEGAYQEAIDLWSGIIDDGRHSAELYFNLGNAYYKLNQIGPSIYYYEKALQLDPSDKDIKNNLAFAQNARIDVIEPLPRTIFNIWYERVSGIFSFNGWARVSVVLAFITAGLFLLYYFMGRQQRKRLAFSGSLVAAALMLIALAFAYLTYTDFKNDTPAIVFDESVEIRNEPTMRGEATFLLHEGTKVQVLDEEGEWARIVLADGKDGWLPLDAVKKL